MPSWPVASRILRAWRTSVLPSRRWTVAASSPAAGAISTRVVSLRTGVAVTSRTQSEVVGPQLAGDVAERLPAFRAELGLVPGLVGQAGYVEVGTRVVLGAAEGRHARIGAPRPLAAAHGLVDDEDIGRPGRGQDRMRRRHRIGRRRRSARQGRACRRGRCAARATACSDGLCARCRRDACEVKAARLSLACRPVPAAPFVMAARFHMAVAFVNGQQMSRTTMGAGTQARARAGTGCGDRLGRSRFWAQTPRRNRSSTATRPA